MLQDRVKPEVLMDYGCEILRALGVPPEHADLVLDSLVQADLWGHQSHGVLRLPWYAARIASGAMTARTEPETIIDAGALLLLDGRAGVGQVLTDLARREAVTRARTYGVGVVGVRNSNHFGTAMYYTRAAARDGCVAILTTNASPAIAPWGGRTKVLGTNPWSIAAPAPNGVVAVDIANTAVARGKIYLARNRGESIPDDWAMDAEGHTTTDPDAAIAGVILPMAGHKGYAITFMMDVVSGALTGSNTATRVGGPYEADKPSGAGHLFIAINVAAMADVDDYLDAVGQLIDEVKTAPLAAGSTEIYYPGELEDRNEQACFDAGGILLPDQTRADLEALGRQVGIASRL
ncbi:LDH2 family malate/lactate/ureidoglycolate dehydrogenase [Mycobacterium sp. OAS707]|uniref:Ldh family oxidoreductase n=1 Tax=Mycobacterium sp. OAS707 TaxID=2663822 RepID=UPI001789E5B8|nr:Ldh family oxidoreductase [Mycobacterium sp. OAS707]MBE1551726.1 LDH2 family malate/lactate/ureidoglycolate dehydrogenase [Mycobacterium sp. OAS707]